MPEWMSEAANLAVMVGANLLVQSTIIVAVGLTVARAMKPWGAAVQSVILRAFLVAIFLSPLVSMLVAYTGVSGLTWSVPVLTTFDSSAGKQLSSTFEQNNRVSSMVGERNNTYEKVPVEGNVPPETAKISPIPPGSLQTGGGSTTPRGITPFRISRKVPIFRSGGIRRIARGISHRLYNTRVIVYIVVTVLWFSLSLILLLRVIAAHAVILKLRRNAVETKRSYRDLCGALAVELNVPAPSVIQSPQVIVPFVAGFIRPCIFLPLGRSETSLPINAVLLHELCHYVRHDPFWNLVRNLATIIIPFQPLVWVLSRRIEESSDYVCDDFVVSRMMNHREYAHDLVSIARLYKTQRHYLVTCVRFVSPASPLRRRILRILEGSSIIVRGMNIGLTIVVGTLCISTIVVTGFIGIEEGSAAGLGYAQEVNRSRPSGRETINIRFPVAFLTYSDLANHPLNMLADPADGEQENRDTAVKSPSTEITSGTEDIKPQEIVDNQSEQYEYAPGAQSFGIISTYIETRLNQAQVLADNYRDRVKQHHVISDGAPVEPQIGSGGETCDEKLHGMSGELQPFTFEVSGAPDSVSAPAFLGGNEFIARGLPNNRPAVAKVVNVTIDYDYENHTFDMRKTEDRKTYSLYYGLDKNKNEPVWSPDGNLIAFTDRSRIWMVSSEGGKPTLVYENLHGEYSVGNLESLCFMPDGKEIIFKRDTYDPERGSVIKVQENPVWGKYMIFSNPIPSIVSVDISTGECQVVIDEGYRCYLSRSGRYLCYLMWDSQVYSGATELQHHGLPAVYDRETGETWFLAEDNGKRYGQPTISPDETHVVIPVREGEGSIEFYHFPLKGGKPEQLTFWDGRSDHGKYKNFPEYSPDGMWILYTDFTWNPGFADRRLYVFHTVTRKQHEVFEESSERSAYGKWSPDGKKICYLVETDGGNYIYISNFVPPIAEKPTKVEKTVPLTFGLTGNYPNPFNPLTTIVFSMPEGGVAKLLIYNMVGQKTRELVSEFRDAGGHMVIWDGRDDTGSPVSSGIYFAHLRFGNMTDSHKMFLIK
ncbi:M56 family metallopeptidase [Candidatus Latescibacterota bacterium]